MNRRKFLINGSLTGVLLPALLNKGNATVPSAENKVSPVSHIKDEEFIEITIDELQKKLQSGQVLSKAITKWYLKRIEVLDKKGPALNSVIELNPDAISIAELRH